MKLTTMVTQDFGPLLRDARSACACTVLLQSYWRCTAQTSRVPRGLYQAQELPFSEAQTLRLSELDS